MKKWTTIILTVLFVCSIKAQEVDLPKSTEHYKMAIDAYKAGDWEGLKTQMKFAADYRPNHPRILYNLAAGYSLNGQKDSSLIVLKKLADMGSYYTPEKDSDFVSLWQIDKFNKIVSEFNENIEHKGNSSVILEYPEKDLITESVAYDPVSKSYYLGSIYKGKIVCFDSLKNPGAILKENSNDNIWSVFGLKVDPERRLLWGCTTAIPNFKDVKKEDLGKTGVFKIDLKSGEIVKTFVLSDTTEPHWFGDLVLSGNGDVYVSDSRYNAVYKITKDSDELELYVKPKSVYSMQGLDFSHDEKYLFVADYTTGVYRVNMMNKVVKYLSYPDDLMMLGIDGLYFYNNSLIAVQNGASPQRIVRMYLNDTMNKIMNWKTVEVRNPEFDEPTLGTIIDDKFYYIGNSQWGAFNNDGSLKEDYDLSNPKIFMTELER